MSYIDHAKREFKALGYDLDDKEEGPNKWIMENVLELLKVFGKQGHSGSSAPFVVRYFEKLALFKPLGPLTGEDDEWGEGFCDEGTLQNKRCSHVFKDADGTAYDIEGKIFREPDGCCFTSKDSHTPVEFPYTPKSEYVDVPKERE